jgi:ABC-type lipoprotein export system ATPase subunit
VITHEEEVAARAHRVIRLRDGEVMSDTTNDAVPEPAVQGAA